MGKRIVTLSLLTCCTLVSVAPALTADDYVIAGRARLFEGTAVGLIEACDIFEAGRNDTGCPDCPGDRELVLLHAIAKTAMLFIDHNDVLTGDGLFGLAEEFGIPLAAIAPYDCRGDFDDNRADACLWVSGVDHQTMRQRLVESILPELEGIIAQLGSITDFPAPFLVYLVPGETGLASDLEIDYGDVLIFKGLLLAYKGLLAAEMAQTLEVDDPCPEDEHASLLGVLSIVERAEAGHELPAQARGDFIEALTCYLGAIEAILSEDDPIGSDPQGDELVYIDPDAQSHLDVYRETLAALQRRLAEGGDAVGVEETVRTYEVYGAEATPLGELSLVFDYTGTEGTRGRLVLSDGAVLEVDWFCVFEESDIGVSLFCPERDQEAWLEGTLGCDEDVIWYGALEAWGMDSGLPSEADRAVRSAAPLQLDAALSGNAPQIPLLSEATVDRWRRVWSERLDILAAVSRSWFLNTQRVSALPPD